MLAALDLAHVRSLDAGYVSQVFLSDPILRSGGDNCRTEGLCRRRVESSRARGSTSLNCTLLHKQKRQICKCRKPR